MSAGIEDKLSSGNTWCVRGLRQICTELHANARSYVVARKLHAVARDCTPFYAIASALCAALSFAVVDGEQR